jgi:hypothetical protein
VKSIVCLGVITKKIDVFGNVVDVVLEVTMDDAVRMAQRLRKEILFYYHLPVLVLICLKIEDERSI